MSGDRDGNLCPVRSTPYRTPIAVSDAIQDLLANKVVCDLGCAEGDNLLFMARYAKEVLGVEQDEERYQHAIRRGFRVVVADYLVDDLPEADVYYIWPNDGPQDNPRLVKRLKDSGRTCTVVIAADTGFPYEVTPLHKLSVENGGKVIEVAYDEGRRPRQSGTFLLCVLELP